MGGREVLSGLRWQRDLSRTMVLVVNGNPSRIAGYHTLLMAHVKQEEIASDQSTIKLGIPVFLFGATAGRAKD